MLEAHTSEDEASERDRLSKAIGVARIVCLLGIVYVHGWTGRGTDELIALNNTPQGLFRWMLIDLFGRSSVPLLSIISGWLVGASLQKRGWTTFISGKAQTILAPMVLWNAIAIVLVCGAEALDWIRAPQPTSWSWTLNELFCLIAPAEINVQMPFLRDLFVCMLAVPLLVRLPSQALIGVGAVALVWTLSMVQIPLLQRPQILVFFVLGLLARRHALAARLARLPLGYLGAGYAAVAAVQVWLETAGAAGGINPLLLASNEIVMRVTAALFFWAAAWRLAASRAAKPLLRLEPYAFLMFSSHLIMIWLAGPLIGQFTGAIGSPLYPLFLLLQPALVLGAAVVLGQVLMRTTPSLAGLLSGGRLRVPRPPRRTVYGGLVKLREARA